MFIVFDFKTTSSCDDEKVSIFAKIKALGQTCLISCASMEMISKASIKALDHLIYVVNHNQENTTKA